MPRFLLFIKWWPQGMHSMERLYSTSAHQRNARVLKEREQHPVRDLPQRRRRTVARRECDEEVVQRHDQDSALAVHQEAVRR